MKILGLIYFTGIGGAEKFILHLAEKMIQDGYIYDILLIIPPKPPRQLKEFLSQAEEKKINCSSLKLKHQLDISTLSRIHDHYKRDYNFINPHLFKSDLISASYKRFYNQKAKILSTKHGYKDGLYQKYILKPKELPRNFYFYLWRWVENQIDAGYTCSYSLRHFLESASVQPDSKKLSVIQHGFDYPDVSEKIKNKKTSETLRLLMLGRLHPIKGHQFAFRALPILKEHIDVKLDILGDGDERKNLENLAEELNISDVVNFLGFQTDIYTHLCNSDALLVTSYVEGLPLMILEAFNAELPVIAWDIPGVNELISNNKNGLLVEAYDIEKLAQQILDFNADDSLANKFSAEAKKDLTSHFNSERMLNETKTFFLNHLEKTP